MPCGLQCLPGSTDSKGNAGAHPDLLQWNGSLCVAVSENTQRGRSPTGDCPAAGHLLPRRHLLHHPQQSKALCRLERQTERAAVQPQQGTVEAGTGDDGARSPQGTVHGGSGADAVQNPPVSTPSGKATSGCCPGRSLFRKQTVKRKRQNPDPTRDTMHGVPVSFGVSACSVFLNFPHFPAPRRGIIISETMD